MKKTQKFNLLFMVLGMLFTVSSCKPDEPVLPPSTEESTVNLTFQASVEANPFYMDSSYKSEASQAYKYYFTLLKFYISDVYLVGDNDSVKLSDVELIDFNVNDLNTSFTYKGKTGVYNKIKFGLGLNPTQNASDPANYDVSHPLGAAQGTYWGMNLMYRFTLIEGKFDTTNVGNLFDNSFAVHTGFNKNYLPIVLPISALNITNGVTKDIKLNIDLNQLLFNTENPTDFKTEAVSHSDTPLATAIQSNLAKAITVK